jgi:hypothetical protein
MSAGNGKGKDMALDLGGKGGAQPQDTDSDEDDDEKELRIQREERKRIADEEFKAKKREMKERKAQRRREEEEAKEKEEQRRREEEEAKEKEEQRCREEEEAKEKEEEAKEQRRREEEEAKKRAKQEMKAAAEQKQFGVEAQKQQSRGVIPPHYVLAAVEPAAGQADVTNARTNLASASGQAAAITARANVAPAPGQAAATNARTPAVPAAGQGVATAASAALGNGGRSRSDNGVGGKPPRAFGADKSVGGKGTGVVGGGNKLEKKTGKSTPTEKDGDEDDSVGKVHALAAGQLFNFDGKSYLLVDDFHDPDKETGEWTCREPKCRTKIAYQVPKPGTNNNRQPAMIATHMKNVHTQMTVKKAMEHMRNSAPKQTTRMDLSEDDSSLRGKLRVALRKIKELEARVESLQEVAEALPAQVANFMNKQFNAAGKRKASEVNVCMRLCYAMMRVLLW